MAKRSATPIAPLTDAYGNAVKTDELGRPVKWPGGYIRYEDDGRATFYLYKKVKGRKSPVEFSTRCHDYDSAMAHWTRFSANPAGYTPSGAVPQTKPPVFLTGKLIDDFVAWSEKPVKDGGQANTPEWVHKQKTILAWWMEKLVDAKGKSLDLRTLNRRDIIVPILDKDPETKNGATKNRTKKIAVLKVLYTWLVKVAFLLDEDENQMAPVAVPQAAASQSGKGNERRKVVPVEVIEAVIKDLVASNSIYGWALTVSAGTGWHATEVAAFTEGGDIEDLKEHAKEPGAYKVLYCPRHKNGLPHRTKVNERVFLAAQELLRHSGAYQRGRVGLSISNYDAAVRETCHKLKLRRFTPANMRHTVATYAGDRNVPRVVIKEFLGHSLGSKILEQHYLPGTAPKKIPTPMDHGIRYPGEYTAKDVEALMARIEELEAKVTEPKKRRRAASS